MCSKKEPSIYSLTNKAGGISATNLLKKNVFVLMIMLNHVNVNTQ